MAIGKGLQCVQFMKGIFTNENARPFRQIAAALIVPAFVVEGPGPIRPAVAEARAS